MNSIYQVIRFLGLRAYVRRWGDIYHVRLEATGECLLAGTAEQVIDRLLAYDRSH